MISYLKLKQILRIQSEKQKDLELHESLKDIEVGLFIHNDETYSNLSKLLKI